jgi:rhodanese-related sulfurtransferase
MQPQELMAQLDAGETVFIVDLRNHLEREDDPFKLPGAITIGFEEIEAGLADVPRDRDVVLYCSCPNEVSSARAAMQLKKQGIDRVRPLAGGLQAWREAGYKLEPLHSIASVRSA